MGVLYQTGFSYEDVSVSPPRFYRSADLRHTQSSDGSPVRLLFDIWYFGVRGLLYG